MPVNPESVSVQIDWLDDIGAGSSYSVISDDNYSSSNPFSDEDDDNVRDRSPERMNNRTVQETSFNQPSLIGNPYRMLPNDNQLTNPNTGPIFLYETEVIYFHINILLNLY